MYVGIGLRSGESRVSDIASKWAANKRRQLKSHIRIGLQMPAASHALDGWLRISGKHRGISETSFGKMIFRGISLPHGEDDGPKNGMIRIAKCAA